jgi:membrane-bound ClpP family serine protease
MDVIIIICFIIGIGLLVLEAFMPGFGLPGITGVILEVIALSLTWVEHGALVTLGMLLVVLSILAIAISMSLRSATKGKLSKSQLIHHESETNEAGYRSTDDLQVFLGREGQAVTVLRPTGIADFDGVRLSVSSEGDYVAAGTSVRIIKVEGSKIIVRTA